MLCIVFELLQMDWHILANSLYSGEYIEGNIHLKQVIKQNDFQQTIILRPGLT